MSSPVAKDRLARGARRSPGTLNLPIHSQVYRDSWKPSRSLDLLSCTIETVEKGIYDLAAARTVQVRPGNEPAPDKLVYPDTRLFPPLQRNPHGLAHGLAQRRLFRIRPSSRTSRGCSTRTLVTDKALQRLERLVTAITRKELSHRGEGSPYSADRPGTRYRSEQGRLRFSIIEATP